MTTTRVITSNLSFAAPSILKHGLQRFSKTPLIASAALLMSLGLLTNAQAAAPEIEGKSTQAEAAFKAQAEQVPAIERIIEIEADKIRAIHSADGRTIYMIDNGRYVIVGDFFDMWQRRRISNMDDLARSVRTMDLKGAGFEMDKAVKFSLGEGKPHVTVFVDPNCGWCHRLIDEVKTDKGLLANYTFDFIVVPVLGGQSVRLSQIFSCTTEKDQVKRMEAFQTGEEAILKLPQPEDGVCDLTNYQTTASSARILGIDSVPLIIAPDGRFAHGKPKSIEAFLKGTTSDGGADLPIPQGMKPTKLDPEKAKEIEKALKERLKAQAATESKAAFTK